MFHYSQASGYCLREAFTQDTKSFGPDAGSPLIRITHSTLLGLLTRLLPTRYCLHESRVAEPLVRSVEALGKTPSDQKIDESKSLPVLDYVLELVSKAKQASRRLASLPTVIKDQALLTMAAALEAKSDELLAANEQDLTAFGTTPEKKAMADRLRLTEKRIGEMAAGIREVAKLPDPV